METTSNTGGRDLPSILVDYAGLMAEQREPQDILERLGDCCTQLLPIDGVGVLLRDRKDGLVVATANTEPGRLVENLEAELAEGPCTESMVSGEQVAVAELSQAADRYPRFVPRALEAGVQSIHALPLTVRVEQVGSVDLIAMQPVALSAAELATAQMLADVTVSYLANTRAFQDVTNLAAQLQHALDSRVVIEQAKGMLSERHGIPVTDAFEILRRHARNNGRKIHDLAQEVLRGELDL